MAMTTMGRVETFIDSTALLSDAASLRQRGSELGYLFFKGLVEADPILEVRRQILEICHAHGWLEPGFATDVGMASKGQLLVESTADPRWRDLYCDVQKLRDFHALALHPSIIGMLETLFDEQVLAHPRNICRIIFPHSATHSTPPHQDHFYIGGSEETWTAWIPCGDCPVELGSLAVVPRSHHKGFLDVHEAVGAGGRAVDVDVDQTWAGGDFSCGDVLLLRSLTIHQGRDNRTQRLRLSCDFRYQARSHAVREDSLLSHMGWLTWDEIYAGWATDDALKYYWRDWDLNITRRTP